MEEILMGRANLKDLPKDVVDNLNILFAKINTVRKAYGKPMIVSSGLRLAHQQPKHAAKRSNHLVGRAIDIKDDPQGTLWKWVKENLQLMKDLGLWLEHPNWTHNTKYGYWMHFQIVPPASGKRIFVPSTEKDPNPTFWDGVYDKKFD